MTHLAEKDILQLPFLQGPARMDPIDGGITNKNFVVADANGRYFVRLSQDIPMHGVMRFNELQASLAAAKLGLSPKVVHHAPGVMVLEFIEGKTLTPEDIQNPAYLSPIVSLLQKTHREMKTAVRGPALIFWVFHVIRDYAATLEKDNSRMIPQLPGLLEKSARLERAVGPVDLVFGHNDLLAANFIDDGHRLWLIDWDYAGYNSPLFDLANLAANNELSTEQQAWLAEAYFDGNAPAHMDRSLRAMKCASALRESMWSMVSEIHSSIDFDFVAYTTENLSRFDQQWSAFVELA
jgi:thiamine kinase-like enzyme